MMTKIARIVLIACFTAQAAFAQSSGYQPGSAIHFGDTSKYLNQTHSSSPSSSTSSTTTFTSPKSTDAPVTTTTTTKVIKPSTVKRNGRYYKTPAKSPVSTASINSSAAKSNKSATKDMMREDSQPASTATASTAPSSGSGSSSSSSSSSNNSNTGASTDSSAADASVQTAASQAPAEESSPKQHRSPGSGLSLKGLKNFGKGAAGIGNMINGFRGGNVLGGFANAAVTMGSMSTETAIKPDAPPSTDYSSPIPQESRGEVNATTSTSATIIKKEKPIPLIEDNRPVADKWAIVMGVSKFKDPNIPPLHYAAKDARDFADFLVKDMHFAPDHVRLLLNEKATKNEFLAEIGDKFLPRVVHRDDLVILYFSSHGTPADRDVGGSNFVAAYDTDKTSLYSTGIEMQELTRILRERTPKKNGENEGARVCIFMDACHSGGGADSAKGTEAAGIAADAIDVGRGQMIISSSSGNEVSWESKRYSNGVFTHYLMSCLKGNIGVLDGVKTVTQKIQDEVQQDYATTQTVTVNSKKWQGKKLVLGSVPANPQPLPPSVAKLLGPDSHGQK